MELHVRDKILLTFCYAIVILSTLSYYTFQYSDPDRCNNLLQDGFWLGSPESSKWQPSGCMMHKYTATEAALCLYNRRAVFIGGARTLSLFEAVATKVDTDYKLPSASYEGANVLTSAHNVRLQFVWDPYLEGSELNSTRMSHSETDQPVITVVGVESDRLLSDDAVSSWSTHMDSLMLDFGLQKRQESRSTLFVPLWDMPVFHASSPVRRLNNILQDFSSKHGADVAFAFDKIIGQHSVLSTSRAITNNAASAIADILLNYKCNEYRPKQYPFASTCCNSYPKLSWVQAIGYLFVAILVPIAAFFARRATMSRWQSKFMSFMPAPKYHGPLLTMGLVVVLCYYCDRTNIFGKEHKFTSPTQFFVLMIIIIVASSAFTTHTADKDLAFLNRDQTDEWKGWMQIAILVYHYVGVSQTPWIYNYMRVMPTSYLFMTGFGHTVYYLQKADFSFKRFVATMLRLNLLNVVLAYAMGNDWLLYYFAPLVTWNYFVILAILYPYRQYNDRRRFVFLKMAIVALLNTAFYRIPGVLEVVWFLLRNLFNMHGDMREWRFRVTLDQYSIFPGMICAILFIGWKDYQLPKSPKWPFIKTAAVGASIIIMLAYALFEGSQPSKQVYNQKHTYVSWLPCCAFIIIRNSTPWLRNSHNKFFAWAGRGSLETFLLQFHIWLAADTAGLLQLPFIPANQRVINVLITTPLFLYVASLVTAATGPVIEWIMGAQPKTLPTAASKPSSTSEKPAPVVSVTGTKEEKSEVMAPLTSIPQHVPSGIALNGLPTPVELKVQDPEKLEQGLEDGKDGAVAAWRRGHGGRAFEAVHKVLVLARGDLRVRVGLIMTAMVLGNWTYNFHVL